MAAIRTVAEESESFLSAYRGDLEVKMVSKKKPQRAVLDRKVRFELELYREEIEWVQNQLNCSPEEAVAIMREKIKDFLRERLAPQTWTLFEGLGTRRDRLEFSVRGEDLGDDDTEAVYEGACGWWFPK